MAPPTPLAVATSSVQRLVKEEAYYHKDLASQQARIAKLEKDIAEKSADLDENADYVLKQEVCNPPPISLFTSFSNIIRHHQHLPHRPWHLTHLAPIPQKRAAEETKNVFGPLRSRIADAVSKLEEQIAIGESGDGAEAELAKAREVLKQGQDALKAEA